MISSNLEGQPPPDETGARSWPPEEPPPPGLRMAKNDGGRTFSLRWWFWEGALLAPAMAMVAFFVSFHFLRSVGEQSQYTTANLVLGSSLCVLGLGILYWSLCVWLNRTIIEAADGCLTIRHKPLPWSRGRTLAGAEIERLYCRRYQISRRHKTYLHDLMVVTRDGRRVALLSGREDGGVLYYLERALQPVCGARRPPEARPRTPVARPASIREKNDGDTVRWTYRWFSPGMLFLLLITLFWNGALVAAGETAVQRNRPALCVLPLFLLIGCFCLYYVICQLVNRTIVTVAGGGLTVRHGPLPLRRGLRLARGDVFQFFCHENNRPCNFELRALLKSGEVRQVMLHLTTPEEALFLEQEIERRLRIRDQDVPHESRI